MRELSIVDKREVLTLPELSATVDESLIGGSDRRMRHADFIGEIVQMLEKGNIKHEVEPLHVRMGGPSNMPNITFIQNVAKNYSGERPLEAHLIRNLAGKIQINELSDELSNQALAFSFNQNGIQLAYGMNVHACSNLCVWGENVMYSYGKHKHPINEIFSILGDWLQLLDKKRAVDLEYMNKLAGIEAGHPDVLRLMGELLVEANKKNMKEFVNSESVAPLNDTQVSAFAKDYVRKFQKIDKIKVENMWDVYNIGTALLRPDRVNNFEPIYRQNKALGDFMIKQYNLN